VTEYQFNDPTTGELLVILQRDLPTNSVDVYYRGTLLTRISDTNSLMTIGMQGQCPDGSHLFLSLSVTEAGEQFLVRRDNTELHWQLPSVSVKQPELVSVGSATVHIQTAENSETGVLTAPSTPDVTTPPHTVDAWAPNDFDPWATTPNEVPNNMPNEVEPPSSSNHETTEPPTPKLSLDPYGRLIVNGETVRDENVATLSTHTYEESWAETTPREAPQYSPGPHAESERHGEVPASTTSYNAIIDTTQNASSQQHGTSLGRNGSIYAGVPNGNAGFPLAANADSPLGKLRFWIVVAAAVCTHTVFLSTAILSEAEFALSRIFDTRSGWEIWSPIVKMGVLGTLYSTLWWVIFRKTKTSPNRTAMHAIRGLSVLSIGVLFWAASTEPLMLALLVIPYIGIFLRIIFAATKVDKQLQKR
jgi:hypothetical protein